MRLTSRREGPRKGFALLVVIWGLGAIALLVVSFLATGRLRLQTAFNIAGAAQAQAIAAAAADLAILALAEERVAGTGAGAAPAPRFGAPDFCALDTAVVAVAIEDESGKVDLNTASSQLLKDALIGLFALSPAQAGDIARGIETFRTLPENDLPPPPALDGKPFGPKRAAFQTALELDQVTGVDAQTFRALLPFVTVHSRADGIDPHVAPPALLAALLGMSRDNVAALAAAPFPNRLNRDDPRFPSAYRQTGAHGAFLIHIEVVLANGPSGLREAIVELQPSDGALYAVREIRTGAPRYLDTLRRMRGAANALPPC
jgi:general secretion pathway protein K